MNSKSSFSSGKAVLITGCSSGIGRATALCLARSGFTVFASVRKESDAMRLREENEPNLFPICPLDLTRLEDIPAAISRVQAELARRSLPGLYALINNAGSGAVAPLELLDPGILRTELQTRLVGATAMVQACLPLLRKGKGRIVWILTPATIPTPYVSSIHACDFAANCLARTLEIELKPWNIPNIQIRCGGIRTPAGLETTAQVETILKHPQAGLYHQKLSQWSKEMAEFDHKRVPAEKVAQTVLRALSAARPRRRYSIGHMAGLAGLLEALPQPLTDAILSLRF